MTMDRVWALSRFTFNGQTYDDTNGGPLSWSLDRSTNSIEDRVGDQIGAGAVLCTEQSIMITITMRDPWTGLSPGTKSDLVLTWVKNDGTGTETVTASDMVFTDENAAGQKSIPAQSALTFRRENASMTSAIVRV